MKLTAFILLTACLTASAAGKAQTIKLDVKDAPLESVFAQIKKQSGYTFVYYKEDLARGEKITLHLASTNIDEVLQQVLKGQPLTYKIVDKTIVIAKREDKSGAVIPSGVEALPPPIDITGKVTDAEGNPLVGANVRVKGTSIGTTTNNDGVFVLRGVDKNATLEISYVGYETYTVAVNNRTTIVASLTVKPESLNEVVINKGYYTEKQRMSVGNVGKVTSKDIEKQPVDNPLLALEGRVPGLFINQFTGVAGSAVTVRIQGQNSLQKGNEPLYIIDGVPYTSQLVSTQPDFIGSILGSAAGTVSNGNPLSFLNPNDIESIEILKDADATAIYGSRAANGAILITTKKGRPGKTTVNINLQNGWGHIPKEMNLLNTQQYLQMRHEALKNDNANPGPFDYDINGTWDTTKYTDWQKELIGNTSHYLDAQASVSGGNKQMQYLIGSGYHRETSVFPGDYSDQKGSIHFNINSSSLNQKFKIALSGNYLSDNNELPANDLTPYALRLAPIAPPLTNDDGSLNWAPNSLGNTTWTNGIHPLAYTVSGYRVRANNLIGNSIVSYQVLPFLNVKANLGYTNLQTDEVSTIPLTSNAPENRANSSRIGIYSNNSMSSWIVEPQLNFSKAFGKSKVDLLAGATMNQMNTTGQVLFGYGYVSDALINDIKSAASISVDASTDAIYKYNAFFGRANYMFNDKYILNATYRRDGSSRYGEKNRFHNFGSVGAAWIFTNESFFNKTNNFLSFGKLRASYGTTGNDQIGDYQYLSLLSSMTVGVPYQNSIGLSVNSLTNPYLQWEETKKLQGGLDLGFFKDRLIINASYYHNRSSNQLLTYALPIVTGFNNIVRNFPATVDNFGWEFLVSSVNFKTSNFGWNSTANLTLPENKLVDFPNLSTSTLSSTLVIGEPITIFKLYHFLGTNSQTGIYQFADAKGGATTRPDTASKLTQTVIANTSPEFYGGLTNSFTYKRIELAFTFQFVKQLGSQYLYNGLPGRFSTGNQPAKILDRWQKTGDVTDIQKFTQTFGAVSTGYSIASSSDLVFRDASYIRLKNASLSWALPESIIRRMRIQNLRIYAQGQNLLTFTKYTGFDPETKSATTLPPLRVITIGIQASL